ncbi:hypothetical protein, partial [Chryseobacterium sp. SIMBA_028]|uniref:hypothetical protein n=1 Tax=Chryseobacterium sp. SIMBA_028 TaxID=3085771 RepID=UPI00397ADE52
FSGSSVPPVLNSASIYNILDIYGSSEWQAGMTVKAVYMYYRNSNSPKTIKSNGVEITDNDSVYFEEESSVSLLDDFVIQGALTHTAGTFNTNNHKVSVQSYSGNAGGTARTLNLGSSDIYVTGVMYEGNFSANSSALTLNAGTSTIYFTGLGYPELQPYAGQHYYNVSFEAAYNAVFGGTQSAKVYYNRV